MRKLKTILAASVVAASLYAAAGTAWARSDEMQRGTSWTGVGEANVPDMGVSWEVFSLPY